MKKLLTITVAVLVLMGAAADANAFGIRIVFGGIRFHHVGRHHHYGSNRHHRSETRQASRAVKSTKPTREAKAETTKVAPGTHLSAKDEVPAKAQAVSGEQKAADAAWQTYQNLPQAFRDSVGPVGIFTFASIADFRRITQIYGARDAAVGYSVPVDFKDVKGFYCRVALIGQDDLASTLVHELGHCVDFRHKIGHSMPLMEAFFQDSTKDTKEKLIDDGFGYYTTEPQEAFAQAISHYLVPSIHDDYAKWEADWPNLNAHVRTLLDDAKIAYISPNTRVTAQDVAAKSQDRSTTTQLPIAAVAAASAAVAPVSVPVAPLDY